MYHEGFVSKCTLGPTHVRLLPYIFDTCRVIITGSSTLLGEKKGALFSRLYVSLFLLILWKLVLWVWNTGLRRIIKILADLSPRASKHSGPKALGPLQASAPIPLLWHLALSGIPVHSGGWNSLVLVWNVTQHLPTFEPIWKIHW